MRRSRTLLSVLAFLWLLSAAAVTASPAAPVRAAILGDAGGHWDDELAARLSGEVGVALVEREQLRRVADEQALRAMLDSRAGRERLGNLVAADLLLLPAPADAGVRLTVCDTRLGVTLHDVTIATAGRPREAVAADLRDESLVAVRRFTAGVRCVVAVPDFVSRDLTFERAFLQSDYAEVVRAAFRQLPGVALVAVDEAREIAAERERAGAAQKDRPVPAFVEGEYRTTRGDDGAVTVRITLRARDGTRTLAERTLGPSPLEAAGPQLLAAFNADLAPLARGEGPAAAALDSGAQFDALTRRADQFSSLGEFRRSAALREAALLLKPDADAQRVQLVREYARRNARPFESGQFPRGGHPDEPARAALVAQVVTDWARSLQHCEYLVRNRRLNREEACDLVFNAAHAITGVRVTESHSLGACETLKKQFLREVFARIASLDPAPPEKRARLTGAIDVHYFLFDLAVTRCDDKALGPDDLDLIADLLLNRLPPELPPSYNLLFFLQRAARDREKKDFYGREPFAFTAEQYADFLARLAGSDRPLARLYGRFGRFCVRRYGGGEKASPELLEEARAIVADAKAVGFDVRQYDYFMTQLRDQVAYLDRELTPRPSTPPAAPRHVAAARPAAGSAARPAPAAPAAPARPRSVVTLEPVELTLTTASGKTTKLTPATSWRSGGGRMTLTRYRPLGEGLDAFWSRGALLFMREPGKVVEVLTDDHDGVTDVVGDGKFVWAASAWEGGVRVLDRQGKVLARIGRDQGLPPADIDGPKLLPLSPGRILATGSFGNEQRGWIATIDFDGSAAKVDVFHEATKVWDYKRDDNPNNPDPAMCFSPGPVFEYVTPGPRPRRIVFIGRRWNPLMVDPETKKVWVYPAHDWRETFPRAEEPGEAFLGIDGVLWIAGADRDVRSWRLDEKTGLLQPVRERPDWHIGNVTHGTLARDGDWLYYAGSAWRRINLRTGREEVLVDDPRALPGYGSGQGWLVARSSHYGMVAFAGGALYRLRLPSDRDTTKAN